MKDLNWKEISLDLANETKLSWRRIAIILMIPKSTVSDHLRPYKGLGTTRHKT